MSLWGLESLKTALNGESLFAKISGVDFIDTSTSAVFDFDYLARSGNKCLKESFDSVLANGIIPPSFLPTIGRLITLKYAAKWNGLYRQSARMYDEQFNPLLTDDITVFRNLSSSDNSETQTSAKRLAVSSTDEKRIADETHERIMNEAANKAGERLVDDNRVTDRNYQEARQMSEKESRETNEDVSGSESYAGTESETGSKTFTKSGSVVDSGTSSSESMEKVDGNTKHGTSLTTEEAMENQDFIRYAIYRMSIVRSQMRMLTGMFSHTGFLQQTPEERQSAVYISDFARAAGVYLHDAPNQFNTGYLEIPNATTVPCWQGMGKTGDLADRMTVKGKIQLMTDNGPVNYTNTIPGVIAVVHDSLAMGVSAFKHDITSHYIKRVKGTNYFDQMMGSFFVDPDLNVAIFRLA